MSGVKPEQKLKTTDQTQTLAYPQVAAPWQDRSLAPQARLEAYKGFVIERLSEISQAFQSAQTNEEREGIIQSADTQFWLAESPRVAVLSPQQFCAQVDIRELSLVLGKHLLGVEAWRSQGIEVGELPPLPGSLTKELLLSSCRLHPRKLIKDTHLLVLVPAIVNGEQFSALKLAELCKERKGSGEQLICEGHTAWRRESWAAAPHEASEWVLVPMRDPAPGRVTSPKHFRDKSVQEQEGVRAQCYGQYREATTLEIMTAALLNDMVHGKPRMLGEYQVFLRCKDTNSHGARNLVGYFDEVGLKVMNNDSDKVHYGIGLALARTL